MRGSEIPTTTVLTYGVYLSVSQYCVGEEDKKKKLESKTSESVRWLKGVKPEDLEEASITWIGQVNVKIGAADEVVY